MQIRTLKNLKDCKAILVSAKFNGRGAEATTHVVKGLNDDMKNAFEVDLELDKEHTSVIPMGNHMSNRPNVSRLPQKRQKVLDIANKFIEYEKLYNCSKI